MNTCSRDFQVTVSPREHVCLFLLSFFFKYCQFLNCLLFFYNHIIIGKGRALSPFSSLLVYQEMYRRHLNFSRPARWGYRIRQRYFCVGVTNSCPWYDTKQHLIMTLKFLRFGDCAVPFIYCILPPTGRAVKIKNAPV